MTTFADRVVPFGTCFNFRDLGGYRAEGGAQVRWKTLFRADTLHRLDGSDLDAQYQANAERILLQSVAASTMSAHLAAAALGYQVWWVTAIGQERAQTAIRPLLGVPDELAIIDIMLFGVPAKPPYKRWKEAILRRVL